MCHFLPLVLVFQHIAVSTDAPIGLGFQMHTLQLGSEAGQAVDALFQGKEIITGEDRPLLSRHDADDARRRLDTISADIIEAKATFKTIKTFFIGICVATWGFISAMLLMWAKHHYGW